MLLLLNKNTVVWICKFAVPRIIITRTEPLLMEILQGNKVDFMAL